MNRNRTIGFALALLIFIADQAMKAWVVEGLGIDAPGKAIEVVSFFDLRFVANIGVSLGLLAAETDTMRWALVALTAAIAGGVGWWMLKEQNRNDMLALALVLPMSMSALAQDAAEDEDEETSSEAATLDRVTVVGSRINRAATEGPAPVQVI
ncbi:MAG: signal peptidase II, partial [Candidatus Sericytochromatia bacterium]